MSDRSSLFIRGLVLDVLIGVYDSERKRKQSLILDIEVQIPAEKAMKSDAIEDTFHYHQWCDACRVAVAETEFQLLESLANFIAEHLQQFYPAVIAIDMRLQKLNIIDYTASCGFKLQRRFKE
jgi:7,8-dihydroneopterin aldolase/epimerase/oxygenase